MARATPAYPRAGRDRLRRRAALRPRAARPRAGDRGRGPGARARSPHTGETHVTSTGASRRHSASLRSRPQSPRRRPRRKPPRCIPPRPGARSQRRQKRRPTARRPRRRMATTHRSPRRGSTHHQPAPINRQRERHRRPDGEATPPSDGKASPPTHGATTPPTEGTTAPPTHGEACTARDRRPDARFGRARPGGTRRAQFEPDPGAAPARSTSPRRRLRAQLLPGLDEGGSTRGPCSRPPSRTAFGGFAHGRAASAEPSGANRASSSLELVGDERS